MKIKILRENDIPVLNLICSLEGDKIDMHFESPFNDRKYAAIAEACICTKEIGKLCYKLCRDVKKILNIKNSTKNTEKITDYITKNKFNKNIKLLTIMLNDITIFRQDTKSFETMLQPALYITEEFKYLISILNPYISEYHSIIDKFIEKHSDNIYEITDFIYQQLLYHDYNLLDNYKDKLAN